MKKEIDELNQRLVVATSRAFQAMIRGQEALRAEQCDMDAVIDQFEICLNALKEVRQIKHDAQLLGLAYGVPAGNA